MRPHCLLPCLVALVQAEWWDDFSNNLASDLAPILALFGEQVTKQFLSESTTRLDTFIFAMVPLGILTAVVSAIRVCGGPSLRAFIGRAQEGGGVAEAELCSSTSRDVCELYHNGAVVRVFGRPKIAELVHEPKGASFYEKLGSAGGAKDDVAAKCGIYTFQEYINSSVARDAGWTENGAPVRGNVRGSDHIMMFAPNPNLSLNYGIKRHPKLVNWLAAFAGLVLQASVLWFGALATYKWRWKKNDAQAPPWAFPMMVFGTCLQCFGMWWCAHLIDVSSKERVFRKKETSNHSHSSLHVVQPGNQVVGDQTLDSFSFQDVILPSREYITSWKDPQQSDHPKTTTASVAVTMAGFILQFISLRAQHSAVSVFQLGAILAMSLIRSMLRTQRLKRGQNLLHRRPDEVQGYELDWLVLQMERSRSAGRSGLSTPLYYTTSTSPATTDTSVRSSGDGGSIVLEESCAGGVESACAISYSGPPPAAPSRVLEEIKAKHVEWLKRNECPDNSCLPHHGVRLFYCRARLAELTSSPRLPLANMPNAWGDELVKSRTSAFQLKNAIEASADVLFSRGSVKKSWERAQTFTWSTSNLSWCPGSGDQARESWVHLSLERSLTNGNKFSAWRTEQKFLEAAIGLSAWSIISDPLTETTDSFENLVSAAAEVCTERIWAVDVQAERLLQIEAEMKFWMEEFPVLTSHRKFGIMPQTMHRSPATLWSELSGDALSPILWPYDKTREDIKVMRFFGMQALRRPDSLNGSGIFALSTRTRQSLTSLCAHEVYSSFICGVAEALETVGGKLGISFGRDGLFLQNDVISKLVDCFESTGLGSKQDAYSIIVSALRNRGKLRLTEEELPHVINTAEKYKRGQEYEKAEKILQWAWNTTLQLTSDLLNRPEPTTLASIMLELGELYRSHMYSSTQTLQSFARSGLDWIQSTRATLPDLLVEVFEVMDRYLELSSKPMCGHIPPPQQIIDAIFGEDRVQTLWLLSQKGVERLDAGSDGRTVLSWAAQQGWQEVVKAILDMGHDVGALDRLGRTALSYAAEQGHTDIIEILMSHQASPISKDLSGRTPLSYAASGGSVAAIEVLMTDRRVSIYTKDEEGRSPLHFAAEKGQNETITVLLQGAKADLVNDAAENGITPLYSALSNDHQETVKLLIREGADSNAKIDGEEPWSWALRHGYWPCLDFAFENLNRERSEGSKFAVLVELRPRGYRSDEPAMANREGLLESFTERGGLFLREFDSDDENEVVITLKSGSMFLNDDLFVRLSTIDRVEGHLKVMTLGSVPSQQKIFELLASHMGDDFYVTEEMLQVGARNCDFDEETMKWLLCWRNGEADLTEQVVELATGRKMGALGLIELFVKLRGDAIPVSDAALKLAAGSGDVELLRFVQDRLKRAIPREAWQTLALYQAVEDNDGKTVQELLGQGIDPNFRLRGGLMLLHHAVKASALEVVRVLALWPTVNVEAWDERGHSALYYASADNITTGVAKTLLDAGADPCRPVKDGQTPFRRAKRFRQSKVVELFERYSTSNADNIC